jgi:hypothetical protein
MRLTGEPLSVGAVLGTALLAVTGGVLFEGILVGSAQASVLRARDPSFRIVIVGLTCLAAGIVVGAVHGLFLVRLLDHA